jgi:hypothetical protein
MMIVSFLWLSHGHVALSVLWLSCIGRDMVPRVPLVDRYVDRGLRTGRC